MIGIFTHLQFHIIYVINGKQSQSSCDIDFKENVVNVSIK